MPKECDCSPTADKIVKQSKFDMSAFCRILFLTIFFVGSLNTCAYYFADYYYISYFFSLTSIIILLIIITGSRTVLVGTCCLPDLQLTKNQVNDIISTRNISAEQRILGLQGKYAKTFSEALQIKTISWDKEDTKNQIDYAEFDKIREFIYDKYPNVHKHLKRTIINGYSLVYEWTADEKTRVDGLKPILLTAHLDVVPTPDVEKWEHPPFSGHIDNEFIWGRGAIDDKQNVFSILEAIEDILIHNPEFTPSRDIYLGFGHDEEISGWSGAKKIAEYFEAKLGKDCFEFVCDEGLFIMDGTVPGHKKPVAFVCIAEKGYLTIELSIDVTPGHASTPPKETAIGILANALAKIEANPMPAHFEGPAHDIFVPIRGGFNTALRFIVSNLWLFGPILLRILASSPLTATIVRTTSALTIVNSGTKHNVLPSRATAIINHRIHPQDTVDAVVAWNKHIINDDRIKQRIIDSLEPAPVSDPNHFGFKLITNTIYKTFQDICSVVPGMFVANSDSRHYWGLTDQIFRFNPILLRPQDISMFHGFNEKISIDAYAHLIIFWRNLIVSLEDVYNKENKIQCKTTSGTDDVHTKQKKIH